MAAPATNGAGALPPDMMREQGTAVDSERVFSDFNSGRVFEPADITPRRIDKMLKVDGKARSIEEALTLPLRSAPWSIEPRPGDTGQADWLREVLTRAANAGGMTTPIELVISQAVTACIYRRAFFEKVFKVDDSSRVVYDKVAFRPAGTCWYLFNKVTGTFRGFSQYVGPEHPRADEMARVTIAPRNAFVFVNGQHRRPVEGISDLETVYTIFEIKQKLRFLWMTFLENMTMPKAIAQDDSDDPDTIAAFAQKAATLKGGGVLGIGKDQSLTAFETSIAAADAYEKAMRYLDSEMTASVLAGMLDLTHSSGRGSYALSRDASDLFLKSRESVLTELGSAIGNFLLADLVRFNFGNRAPVPLFKFGQLRSGDVQMMVTLLQAFATSPQTSVPHEFIDELAIAVAKELNLNIDVVMKAIKDRQAQGPQTGFGKLQGGVDALHQLVQSLPSVG